MAQTNSPADVLPLLQAMVGHRQRVVRQIAGVPLAAQAALSAASSFDSKTSSSSDKQVPSSAASGWKGWLQQRAAQSSFLQTLYEELTPSGRRARRLRNEEEDARYHEAMRARATQGARLWEAFQVAQEDLKFLSRTDAQLISVLREKGYFSASPSILAASSQDNDESPVAHVSPGAQGTVIMVGDRMGDYLDPTLNPVASGPDYPDPKTQMANQWARGETPDNHVEKVYERWMVLFHEVAHCESGLSPAPFQPSAHQVSESGVRALNNQAFGALASSSWRTQKLLDENFADAHAAMVLLEATGHDPRARSVLEKFYEQRKAVREKGDMEFLDNELSEDRRIGEFDVIHATDFTLRRVLDSAEEWKGLPPEQVRDRARSFASDGLMDFLEPSRQTIDGRTVGRSLAKNLVPQGYDPNQTRRLLAWMVRSEAVGGNPSAWLDSQDPSHPSYPVLAQSWNELRPTLPKLFEQPVESDHPHYQGKTVGESLKGLGGPVADQLASFIQSAPLPVNHLQSDAYQQAQRGAEAERAAVEQALGAATLSPAQAPHASVVLPAPSQWLAQRRAASVGPAPSAPRTVPGPA